MNGKDVFAEVAHDLRGALGSLRLVMSALVDDDDPVSRRNLLSMADDEAQRIALGLAALPALGLAATDDSDPVSVDLAAALEAAVMATARYGATVSLENTPPSEVSSRPAVLALVLPALLLLASGTNGTTEVSTESGPGWVAISCVCDQLWPQAHHLTARLAHAVGGEASAVGGHLRLVFPVGQ